MKRLIRQILKEETENKNINSILEMISALFNDVVVDIEVGEIREKPFIRVQIKTDDPAVNIDNWYAQQMVDIISDYTGGDFKLMPWWLPLRRDEVFDAYLDVYRKRFDDEGNALKESRRPIKQPRAEDFEKYKDILDGIVYQFVPEDEICGYGTEYFLNAGENAVRIILYYKDDKYPGIRTHMEYAENIKHFVESYLPMVSAAFVPSDTTKCKKEIKESKDETNYLPIIEKLVESFKEDECICDIDMWYDDEDDMYGIFLVFGSEELNDNFTSNGKMVYVRKKQIEVKDTIQSYLPIKNIYIGSYSNPNCGWKPLNESKDDIQKNLSAIRDIIKTISWDGLCDIWVDYNNDDKEYEIRSKYVNTGADFDIYFNELEFLERTLKSMGLRPYIFAPYFVENCEDEVEFLN